MDRALGIPCTVVRSAGFSAQAEAIEADCARMDEVLRGAEWVIARTHLRGRIRMVLNPGQTNKRLELLATVGDEKAELTAISEVVE